MTPDTRTTPPTDTGTDPRPTRTPYYTRPADPRFAELVRDTSNDPHLVLEAEKLLAAPVGSSRTGGEQQRCQTITNTIDSVAQCWFYTGHVGPHWFGGEDYADTVARSLTGMALDEARKKVTR